jgi:hypothetical protein
MALKAVSAPLGSPVGGSGTPGTIPVWSGSGTTLGDSPLTVSGSNVTGAGAIRATGTSAAAPAFTGSDTDTGIYFPAANQMRFATAGSFVAAFDSTGNFGIGETSPSTYGKLAITVGTTTLALNADATRADVQSYNKPLAINRLGNNTLMNEGGGNVGIGTASPDSRLHALLGTVSVPIAALRIGFNGTSNNFIDADTQTFRNAATTATYGQFTSTALNISNVSGYGLRLPATPGNADTQTLDCYQENPLASTAGNGWTPTLSAAATWGGTQPTVDYARYIRIGSLVFCEVRLSGAAISATYGSTTISQPPVTMNAFAYESAVSVSTGVGSGVGVCTSTSVLLPTLGATAVMRLSWFYFTTS